MHYPLWKEERIPDLVNDDEDFSNLLAERNFETLLEYGNPDEPMSQQQQARRREEAEIAKFNYENYLLRQAELEEEEERMRQEKEETKSSCQANRDDDGDSDNSGEEKGN